MKKLLIKFQTQKGKSSVFVIIILIILIVLGVAFFGDKLPFFKHSSYQVLAPSPAPLLIQPSPIYQNDQYGVKFSYSDDWVVTEVESKNEKLLHSILQITPKGFKGNLPPIKLFYAANPNQLSLEDFEKSSAAKNQTTPVFFSSDDAYTLSGQGIPTYYRAEGSCTNAKCQIYTFSNGTLVYQLVSFPSVNSPNQRQVFDQIFNSLNFIGTPSIPSASTTVTH